MSTKEELKALRAAKHKRENYITLGIIILGALLVTGLMIGPTILPREVKLNPRPMADNTSMGDKNAKVLVEEFSDYQCSHCKNFAENLEQTIVDKYVATGKVRLTFVPFSFISEESIKAAEASYCAADQQKFWEYHDLVFENQGALNQSLFIQLAKDLKLDMDLFQACVDNNTHAKVVEDDLSYGQSKGVNGTPYFLVNGQLVDSSQLEAAIEAALSAN